MESGSALPQETVRLLAGRVVACSLFVAAVNVAYGLSDLWLGRDYLLLLLVTKSVLIATCIVAVVAIRRDPTDWRRAVGLGLVVSAAGYLGGALGGMALGDWVTIRMSGIAVPLGTALFLPWGTVPQALSVGFASLAILVNTYGVFGTLDALWSDPTLIVLVAAMGASIVGASRSHRAFVERDRARRSAEAERDRFFELSVDLLCVVNDRGALVRSNPAWRRQLGWSQDDLQARPWIEFVHPEDRERTRHAIARGERALVHRWRHADGTYRSLSWSRARHDEEHWLASARDITREQAVLEALQASDQRMRTLLETAGTPILRLGDRGQIIEFNPAAERVSGWRRDDVLGRPAVDLLVAEHLREPARELVRRVLEGSLAGSFEADLQMRDGSPRTFLLNGCRLDADPPGAVVVGQDITARRRAEHSRTTLLAIAQDISTSDAVAPLLEKVHRRLAAALAADAVFTVYGSELGSALSIISPYGVDDAGAGVLRAWDLPHESVSVARLAAGESIVSADVASQDLFPSEWVTKWNLGSLVAVPLVRHANTVGCLVAGCSVERAALDEEATRLLRAVASQLAIALEVADLRRSREEDSAVASALALVGRELIATTDKAELLDRLCRVTAEVLECDASHTHVPAEEDGTYLACASFGYPTELWEALRTIRWGASVADPIRRQLARSSVLEVTADAPIGVPPGALSAFGVESALLIALRRGSELTAVQTAAHRIGGGRFLDRHRRIADGISQLASMALANVTLIEQLNRANDFKDEFLATMSHELRTPLNVIIGYGDLLREGVFGGLTPEQRDTVDRMGRSARGLLDMINATLDVSRLENRVPSTVDGVVDVAAFVDDLRAGTEALGGKPNVVFAWSVEEQLVWYGDGVKLRMILENLVGNAIKFTAEGTIAVDARPCDDGVEFVVRDTGIGIPEAAQAKIFEPFAQADETISGRYGGTGLGLYIVRRMVASLHGRIAVTSPVDGQPGTEFRVWVPNPRAAESAHRAVHD